MRSLILFSLITTTIAVLVACNTSGLTVPPGTQCPDGWQPVPMGLNPDQKGIPLNATTNKTSIQKDPTVQALHPGVYKYASTDIYYQQTSSATNPQPYSMQMREVVNPNNIVGATDTATNVGCVHNAKLQMKGLEGAADGITDLTVNNDLTMAMMTRHYTWTTENTNVKVNSGVPSAILSGDPESVTNALPEKVQQFFIIQNSATDFEMRTQFTTDSSYTLYMSVHMNYTPASGFPGGIPPQPN